MLLPLFLVLAASPAHELVLVADSDGIEIVAARPVATDAPFRRDRVEGLRLEVVGPDGRVQHRVPLGDPLRVPYDDFSDPDDPRVGVAEIPRRVFFVRVPATDENGSVRVVDDTVLDALPVNDLPLITSLGLEAPEPVPVRITGPSENRLDLVFLGDGYTADELDRYASDVETSTNHLLTAEPFQSYPEHINVWRLDIESTESGIDRPCEGIERNTALGATYDWPRCLTRMMSYDYLKTWILASRALPEWDALIVLANDTPYAGAMPPFSPGPVFSTRSSLRYLTIHEWVGHDLAGLMDEYDASDDVGPVGVPYAPNCSVSKLVTPWRHWTRRGEPGMGAYPSCAFDNLYRPSSGACIMRVTYHASFDAFCLERAVKGIYKSTRPIDATDPPTEEIVELRADQELDIEVIPLLPANRELDYTWWLDGVEKTEWQNQHWAELQGRHLSPGEHTLSVEVADPTPMVIKDRNRLLIDTKHWTIEREHPPPRAEGILLP